MVTRLVSKHVIIFGYAGKGKERTIFYSKILHYKNARVHATGCSRDGKDYAHDQQSKWTVVVYGWVF